MLYKGNLPCEELPLTGGYFADRSQEIGMGEVIVPPTSELIGKTVVEADFRTEFGLTVIGLRRGASAYEGSLRTERLRVGDTLLLIGRWTDIERLQTETKDLRHFDCPPRWKKSCRRPAKAARPWLACCSSSA